MIRLAAAVLVVAVLLSSTLYAQAQDVSAQLGAPFELGLGDEAEIEAENIVVSFADVVQDSRCPSDVVCIWEGQATIRVLMQVGNGSQHELMLTIGADKAPSMAVGQYSVEMLGLDPYPQSSVQVDPQDYVATLTVSKRSPNSAGVFVRAAGDNSAIVAGWNLERGKGTLVLLSRGDAGTTMSVARFTPLAAQCTIADATECIDGQIVQATGTISQNTLIHLEVSGNTLITTSDGAHSLDIKRIRTSGPASPT